MGQENRDHRRHPLIADVEYQSEGMTQRGRMSDLSVGGIFIDTMNPFDVGTLVHFSFVLPGTADRIDGSGVVAWNQPMVGMGVRFNSLDSGLRQAIERYLAAI
jgi:uncharacterized protein (TIGR02266 family)